MDVARSPSGIVGMLRRRFRLVAALALSATILASAVSLALPRVYRAEARVECLEGDSWVELPFGGADRVATLTGLLDD